MSLELEIDKLDYAYDYFFFFIVNILPFDWRIDYRRSILRLLRSKILVPKLERTMCPINELTNYGRNMCCCTTSEFVIFSSDGVIVLIAGGMSALI